MVRVFPQAPPLGSRQGCLTPSLKSLVRHPLAQSRPGNDPGLTPLLLRMPPNMAPVPRSLAVLATIPGRESALEGALLSLRPQVEQLRVICHDRDDPPECVTRLADHWLCEPDTRGSAAKLHWSRTWIGLYLGCDDDFKYPPDYVETMLRWVQRWKGKALVTIHGRAFPPRPKTYLEPDLRVAPLGESEGAWINFPGAAGIAWDTRLQVPDRVTFSGGIPTKNQEEAFLGLWAQQHRVPIWLVPHPSSWVQWLLPKDAPGRTIYDDEKRGGFKVRQRLLKSQIRKGGWRLHQVAA